MSEFNESVDYAVFDDMVGGLRAGYFQYKDWMGGQFNFTVQDKYAKKRSIHWGKPTIFIANEDPRDVPSFAIDKVGIDWAWMEENCIFYEVKDTIFRANIA